MDIFAINPLGRFIFSKSVAQNLSHEKTMTNAAPAHSSAKGRWVGRVGHRPGAFAAR